jgi:monoamine oxidase
MTAPRPGQLTRRSFLRRSAAAGALLAAGPLAACGGSTRPRREEVVIVGAGLAGLTCAYRLQRVGIEAAVVEARDDRLGGRCFTARGFVDGQVGEHGGEFIDTNHLRIQALVDELGLELEDREAAFRELPPTRGARIFEGELQTSPEVYRGYATMLRRLRAEAQRTGYDGPYENPAARRFDAGEAQDWLDGNVPGGAGSLLGLATSAYLASEFGLDPNELSATSLLYLTEGNSEDEDGSDERFHVAGGNDLIVGGLAESLSAGAVERDAPLRSLRRLQDGGYGLEVGDSTEIEAERVVLALPFTTLREVDLDGAGLSPLKREAIAELGMGTNSKLLLQFDARPEEFKRWNGNLETDHPFQYTWDTSLTQEGEAGLITIYYGGEDGAKLEAPNGGHGAAPAGLVEETLAVLERAAPGIAASFNGNAFVSNWSLDEWARGSYAAFEPGQTTEFAEVAGKPEGGIHFAGEHTSIPFQGFLEGAVASGERAAREVARALQ